MQHALFYTALTTSLWVGELQTLEWRDVDEATIHVRRTAGSEGVKTIAADRIVSLSSDTREAMRVDSVTSRLVFPSRTGRMLGRQNTRKAIHRWADVAGVKRIRPHDLRHTFASMVIAKGANPAELARILGHANAGFTLRRYVHFFQGADRQDAPTLHGLTGQKTDEGHSGDSLPN